MSIKRKEVAYYDNEELDLKLGKRNIEKENLSHPQDSINHPNRYKSKPYWVVLQLKKFNHCDELVRLFKLAVK